MPVIGVSSPAGVALLLSSAPSWGVTAPELSWVFAVEEASFLDASPRMVLMFLLRRWFGFQFGERNGFGRLLMSSFWRRAEWAAASAARASALGFTGGGIVGLLPNCRFRGVLN